MGKYERKRCPCCKKNMKLQSFAGTSNICINCIAKYTAVDNYLKHNNCLH